MKPIHFYGLLLFLSIIALVGVFAIAAYKGAYDGAANAFDYYMSTYEENP